MTTTNAARTANLWFFCHYGVEPLIFDEKDGRVLVRGWFYRDPSGAMEACAAAQAGGFYVEHFNDHTNWFVVIDAAKVPESALPAHLR